LARRFWLLKSDPGVFSWDDLKNAPGRTTCWDGIRNYQARNYLRDEVRAGDGVLFYHSQTDKAVMGVAQIAKAGHPDPTQFDRRHAGHDPDSDPARPRWFAVDVAWQADFEIPVTLATMRREPALSGMVLLAKGSRLSVQPVTTEPWKIVVACGRAK
jgi:predicted RNA-binding protein with PUA-like domain